jgi:hypothetical protein
MSGPKGPWDKTCYQCKETKPTDQFAKRSSKSLRLYRNICTDCWNAYYRKLRDTDERRAKDAAKMREWRGNPENKEKERKRRHAANAASPATVFRMAIHNARMRAPIEITRDDLWRLWEAQHGKCALTGIAMTWAKGKIQPTSISLDRIDSSLNYTVDNVRFICHAVNAFKGVGSDDEMLVMARAIVAKADESEPSWRGFGYSANDHILMVH